MLDIFHKWYRRYLFEEESVLLLVLLTIGIALMTIGDILTPVVAALVLAFLMQGWPPACNALRSAAVAGRFGGLPGLCRGILRSHHGLVAAGGASWRAWRRKCRVCWNRAASW